MHRTERRDHRSPEGPARTCRPRRPDHKQLHSDHDLIEALRAGRVDDRHPDPVARLLIRWRGEISAGT